MLGDYGDFFKRTFLVLKKKSPYSQYDFQINVDYDESISVILEIQFFQEVLYNSFVVKTGSSNNIGFQTLSRICAS